MVALSQDHAQAPRLELALPTQAKIMLLITIVVKTPLLKN